MNNKDKTIFTLKHAQIFYQTLADIIGEKYNLEIIATVYEKEAQNGKARKSEKEQFIIAKN